MGRRPYRDNQELDAPAAEILNAGAVAIEIATGATLLALVLYDEKGVFIAARPGAEHQVVMILGTTDWVEILRIAELDS